MSDVLEYADVVQENRGAFQPGRLKLQTNCVIFKNIKTGRVDTFQAADVEKIAWLLRARGNCLKLTLNNGTIHRFDGLKETEFERLQNFVSNNYNLKVEKQETSYRGWNWGSCEFVANALDFKVNDKLAFEVPLNNVSHSMTGKNEVTLEFHQNDDANVSLMELRFYIAPSNNEEKDPVEEFCKNVLDKADILQVSGDAIAIFQEIQCLTPRGRYDIKIFPTFLQLHGKTFDYKIPFTTILRLFLLPHRDGRQMFFVVSLDPPIKQGQTRYPFLIMLFNKEDETTLELTLTEEELTEKYEGKIQKEMSGLEYEVVSRIMKTFVNRKITVPGSFLGNTGTQSVACSYKAATGFLYPLERGFIFVHKPPIHIRFDEIAAVNFARSAGNTRSFDFDIETKAATVYTFVGIEKDEYGKLYDFVKEKKLRVKNIGGKSGPVSYAEDLDDSADDGQHDAYMERMKREGKERVEDDDDDDDDSTDESYHLPDYGSEVAEEFDTDYSSSNSDSDSDYKADSKDEADEEAREKRREKKEKERKEKKEKKSQKERTKKPRAAGEKAQRKRKKNKDPNRPKRAATAYMLWLGEQRDSIKEENPGISITELTKLAGEKWRGMTAEDKEPFEKEANKDKERYRAEMEEYKKQHHSDEEEEEGSSPKAKKSKKTKSPKKSGETKQGTGDNYKSKEFISDSSDSDDSDKPLKKKEKQAKGSDENTSADEAGDEADSPAEESGKEKSGSDAGSDSD